MKEKSNVKTSQALKILPCLLVIWCASCNKGQQPPDPFPNIVIIFADDMGYGDPTCYNPGSKIRTPHIDDLAKSGMLFTDAHSNSSVCTPSRYGLLTGRYAWRSRLKQGVTWSYDSALIERDRTTVASMLKSKGYKTACIGKWHLGLDWHWNDDRVDFSQPFGGGPNELGFDYFHGITASLDIPPYAWLENDRVVGQVDSISKGRTPIRFEGEYWRKGPTARGFDHYQVLSQLTDKAVDFITDRKRDEPDQPFLLYFPLTAPHLPWIPTEEFRGKSQAGDYGDMVTMVDQTVGKIMNTLQHHGIRENTLVIFTSDNGAHWVREQEHKYDHRANGELLGMKGDIWEGGHRVPFIASWPDQIKPGPTVDLTISITDILATCATISGYQLRPDEGEDSRDLIPVLLRQANDLDKKETVQHSAHGIFAIRQGQWKYIEAQGSGGFLPSDKDTLLNVYEGQLYNLTEDLAEEINLYGQESAKVKELKAKLNQIKSGPI